MSGALLRAPLLTDCPYQLRLAHLRAPLDAELGGLSPQLGDGHRASAAAGALRGAALAGRRLGTLAAESGPRLVREVRDRPLLGRPGLGPLDVLARGLSLLLCGHRTSVC